MGLAESWAREKQGGISLHFTDEQHDNFLFLAFHVLEMVEKLHGQYYAAFELGTKANKAA
jgi:hypothetical protein